MSQKRVEIDKDSGFCFGVVTAIKKAEEELDKSGILYCLGDIVHNAAEVERLRRKGLITITHEDLKTLHDVKVLLRAHGEPPSTYSIARENNIEIIDATCPVVLQLQKRIKSSDRECEHPLIIIYGKPGHAEVNGLVGQTSGRGKVVTGPEDLDEIDFRRPIRLYSQTTKSLDGFRAIVAEIERRIESEGIKNDFSWFDTICRQVANRMDKIREFASSHDVVIFVSGAKSSNGKVLFAECRKVNPRSHLISEVAELNPEWVKDGDTVGICGATSTPAWLMEDVANVISNLDSRSEKIRKFSGL